jgi:hypothetical protein
MFVLVKFITEIGSFCLTNFNAVVQPSGILLARIMNSDFVSATIEEQSRYQFIIY